MTTKASRERQNTSQPGHGNEPNLGQKEAQQQKSSESDLRKMSDRQPASPGERCGPSIRAIEPSPAASF